MRQSWVRIAIMCTMIFFVDRMTGEGKEKRPAVEVDGVTYYVDAVNRVTDKSGHEVTDPGIQKKAIITQKILQERVLSKDSEAIYHPLILANWCLFKNFKDFYRVTGRFLLNSPQMALGSLGGPAGLISNPALQAILVDLSKDELTTLFGRLIKNPKEMAWQIGATANAEGYEGYKNNYEIYKDIAAQSGVLSYDQAQRWMDNELLINIGTAGYSLMQETELQSDEELKGKIEDGAFQKVVKDFASMQGDAATATIPLADLGGKLAAVALDSNSPIAAYKPYSNFLIKIEGHKKVYKEVKKQLEQDATAALAAAPKIQLPKNRMAVVNRVKEHLSEREITRITTVPGGLIGKLETVVADNFPPLGPPGGEPLSGTVDEMDLAEAEKQGLVEVTVTGTGRIGEGAVHIRLKRKINRPLRIIINPGTVFISSDGSAQNLMVH